MQPLAGNELVRICDRIARAIKRNILWLLVGCYAIAAFWPTPGLALRRWNSAPAIFGGVSLSVPLLLLALMLFCAAIATELRQIRDILHRPGTLVVALGAVWLGPALLVAAAGWIVPWAVDGQATAGLLVGLVLVAAMPVANSSVGWTQPAGGNLALSLALVVLSITLSPWLTPRLLALLGSSLSPAEQDYCEALVREFSGVFFIVWVLLPTLAGTAARYIIGQARVAVALNWITLASAAALLLLNYINSSLALPKIHETPLRLLVATTILAVALSVVGLVSGWALGRVLRLPKDTELALLFGLSMKHTGLALVLAGAVLAEQPLAILIIVLATLTQHLLAGAVEWWQMRTSSAEATSATVSSVPARSRPNRCRTSRPRED